MAFTWQSAGHAFASLFKDVVTVSKKVIVALGGLQNEETLIESLTSLVSPQAAAVEQIAFGALGELVAAVQATETAAGATASMLPLTLLLSTEVRKLIVDFPESSPRSRPRLLRAPICWPSASRAGSMACCCLPGMQRASARRRSRCSPILRFQTPESLWAQWRRRCPLGCGCDLQV